MGHSPLGKGEENTFQVDRELCAKVLGQKRVKHTLGTQGKGRIMKAREWLGPETQTHRVCGQVSELHQDTEVL